MLVMSSTTATPNATHRPERSQPSNLNLLSSSTRKLLSRKQLIGAERHGQKLLESHDGVLAEFVVHQYGSVGLDMRLATTIHMNITSRIRVRIRGFLTSQNSRMNCLHMPQGLAGGEMSVATAMARKSPALAPWRICQNRCRRRK
jgi:hypothetical protein